MASPASAGRPFYEDRYSGPSGTVDWLAQTSDLARWSASTVRYTGPCPVGGLFSGLGPPDGPWQGDAGWYLQQNGDCVGNRRGTATIAPTGPNTLEVCSDDPYAQKRTGG